MVSEPSPVVDLGHEPRKGSRRVVYLVVGRAGDKINAKLRNLLRLRSAFADMILVSVGAGENEPEQINVRPFPNPTGLFGKIGLTRIKKAVDRYVFFPSPAILYVWRAQRVLAGRIERDLEDGKEVTVITSVPAHDVSLIGLKLKRQAPSIRWIIDWRDLWSYDLNYFHRTPRLYRKRLLKLERNVMHLADINVTTNEYARHVLLEEYDVPAAQVTAIPQSFDADDLPESWVKDDQMLIDPGEHRTLTLAFMGTLVKPPRVPGDKLVEAVRQVRQAGIDVELHVYGGLGKDMNIEAQAGDGVVLYEKLDHCECLKQLTTHDFLVVLLSNEPNSKAVMSLKLPYYLLVGRPIIAIAPELSCTADVVRRTNSGFVVPADGDWALGLQSIVQNWCREQALPRRDEDEIARFDWNNVEWEWVDAIVGN